MGIKCPKCHSDNTDTARFCSNCAAQLPSQEVSVTKTLETPTRRFAQGFLFAERYEILEELGKGGMGEVYRVKDKTLDEEIALKVLKPEIAANKDMIERFKNELKFARKIAHRNVCKMYDLNEEEATPYITMEYVKGADLKSYIRKKDRLKEDEVIAIAKQVCEGLAEAHELGVVHRDLKPQNIMIDEKGNAKVMDFGIARSVEVPGVTQSGVMIGTPDYMSPEQADGKEADQRSDIYSFGVILYEMVTGKVPFRGDTALSVALKHKSQLPSDPKKLNPEISENLSRLILICMEKERERRYQTAEALLLDLQNLEDGLPLGTRIKPRRETIIATLIRKKIIIPVFVFTLAIAAVIIWQLLPEKEVISVPSDKPSLAVMYFENNTGDEDLGHWRKGISDLLITDLTQSKYLRVLSGDKLFNILSELNQLDAISYSSKVLAKLTSRGRVNYILTGSYSKAGDIFRIDAMLQNAGTGEPIATERVEGRGEESIFSMVDELTIRVKSSFKFSEEQIAGDIDRQVGKITTNSPEAYKYFLEGMKFTWIGDDRKAIEFMEKAIAVDSGFASAYYLMSISYWNLGMGSKGKKYAEKAFELRDRVSDGERYRIEGEIYVYSEKTFDKAIEAYHRVLALHPEDTGVATDLLFTYAMIEEWDKAIEVFEVFIRNKFEGVNVNLYNNLAEVYRAKGLYKEAIEILELYLDETSDNPLVHSSLALTYLCQGKYDFALTEADKALSIHSVFLIKAWIYSCMGEFLKAEKEILLYLDRTETTNKIEGLRLMGAINLSQGKYREAEEVHKKSLRLANEIGEMHQQCNSHFDLAYTYFKSGVPERAIEDLEKAWNLGAEEENLDIQRRALFFKGLIYLEMGSLDKALQTAEELKKLIESGMNKKAIRYYHHLMGLLMLENGNFSKAIKLFNQALSFLHFQVGSKDNHALFIEPLALSYYKSGNLEKAIESYERIISFTTGRLYYGDIYAKSFYMLGKIYVEQGNTAKAIENYQKFLDLWKDADPGIPEVEDARERLAGLKN